MSSGIRTIPFVKASACGNDFLLIEAAAAPEAIYAFTRRICNRHDGVGADGVEWMLPHSSADVEIRLINADGSEAEISGNGTRCVAAYLSAEFARERIAIQTGAGLKNCILTSRSDWDYEFETEMGEAVISPEIGVELADGPARSEARGRPVSMGNPHFVVFVTDFPADWRAIAAEIQRSSHFPQGVNVEWVVTNGSNDVNVRFLERGAGETQSSGTGSCAAAVAAIAAGRAESPVRVHAPGGVQTVRREGNNIFLRGPARLLCRGEFFLT